MQTASILTKRTTIIIASMVLLLLLAVVASYLSSESNKQISIETSAPEGEHMLGFYGHSLDLTQDGGFIVAGYVKYHSRKNRDHDIWVMKVDRDGDKEWCKTFGGGSTDRAWSVKQSQDGEFLVLGETYSFGNNYQAILIKLDKSGKQSWFKLFGGDQGEHGKDLHLSSKGTVLIGGSAHSDALKRASFFLAEVDLDGDVLVEKSFDHDLPGGANSVSELENGDVVLLGNLQNEGDRSIDFGLIRLNKSREFINKQKFGSVQSDLAGAVLAHRDGGYAVVGSEYKDKTNKGDAVVYKFNALDELEWKSYYGGLSADGGEKIISTSDGGYALTGHTNSFGAGFKDVYVIKIDKTGQTEWSQAFGGTNTDWGYDLKQTNDGGFLISAGSKSTGQNATDIWIIKLDKNGLIEWDKVYCVPDNSLNTLDAG